MKLVFFEAAWDEYQHWITADPAVLQRLNGLIRESLRHPFKGTGKPEPLRGELSGWWSRRITQSDRLVYRVSGQSPDQQLEIAQCRFHY